jgi:putative Holliday junction resolvase
VEWNRADHNKAARPAATTALSIYADIRVAHGPPAPYGPDRRRFCNGDKPLSGNLKELGELRAGLKRGQRLMGVDLGSKTIGLALSDVSLTVATPLETIRRTKFTADATRLIELAGKHDVGGLILGLALNMDGTEGPAVQSARAFARNLEKLTQLPISFWDERLSTAAVTRTLIEADASRARRAEVVDKMAAAYILQGALERLRSV